MLEMKITIEAADLAVAINNLAAALDGKKPRIVCNQYGTDNHQIENVGSFNVDRGVKTKETPPTTPTVPVNPTPASIAPVPPMTTGANISNVSPATTPITANPITPVTGIPLSATPAQPVAPAANTVPAPVPTAAPQYTLDMIATAGSALIDAGKMNQLTQLLGKFGVASLTELAPESYGAVAGELRALGATI